jgi:hypothetical protein
MNIFDDFVLLGPIDAFGGILSFSPIVGFQETIRLVCIGICDRIDPCSGIGTFCSIDIHPNVGLFVALCGSAQLCNSI